MLDNEDCNPSCARAECNWDYRDCECATVLDVCDGSYSDGSEAHAPYNSDESRCWLLRPKRDGGALSRIHLHWDRFETEAGYDVVRVYDGHSQLDGELYDTPLSGSTVPGDVLSSGGELLITFQTDHSRAAAGFSFSWWCTGQLDLGAGDAPGVSPNLLLNPLRFLCPYAGCQLRHSLQHLSGVGSMVNGKEKVYSWADYKITARL